VLKVLLVHKALLALKASKVLLVLKAQPVDLPQTQMHK
jgi:hypothetical protein